MSGFATRAVHGALPLRPGREQHGDLRPPLHDTVSFAFNSAQEIADAFAGRKPAHSYTRISNPTVEEFELRVQALAGGRGVVALASGMAAISTTIIALAGAGSNIVAGRSLFGNTISLLAQTLQPWGLSARFVDTGDLAAVAAAIDQDTRAIFVESITNPQLGVCDLAALAELARERGVPLILDNTATTFYLCRAGELGVAIELISATKYISGGGSSVGGLIIDHGGFDWSRSPRMAPFAKSFGPFALLMALRREISRNLGACLAPHNAYLQTLGLETLALRVDKSCANALALAQFLQGQAAVKRVVYPGLADHPDHGLARRQFNDRFGGILSCELADREACFAFLDKLQLVRRATNINDNKSLAIHPASTIFCEFSFEQRREMGVGEGMVRISAGIEDFADLRDDIAQALS